MAQNNQDIISNFIKLVADRGIGAHWDIKTNSGVEISEQELRSLVGDTPVEIIDLDDNDYILTDNTDPTRFGKMIAYVFSENEEVA